jgi:hypothetical protein
MLSTAVEAEAPQQPSSDPTGRSISQVLLRVGLFGTAITGFSVASRITGVGEVTANALSMGLMLALWWLCFGLLISAASRRPHRLAVLGIPVTLAVGMGAFVHVHSLHTLMYGPGTTDLVIFQDYAARLLLQGDNPYLHDLRPAFELHGSALTYSTPLLDGDYTGRMAYPALSTVLFVPLLWAGISTSWAYPLVFVVMMVLLWRASPPALRPLILLPWFFEQRYVLAVLGGVSDIVWATLLVAIVASWKRRNLRGVWYGLACSFKQTVWPLAPFFLIRIWHETPGSTTDRLREMVRYGGVSTLVFLCINGPFILWDPHAWWAGVTEPLGAPMITLGYGLSSLTMAGWLVMAKSSYGALVWSSLAVCLVVYSRHFHRLSAFMWVAPGIMMWFGNRSLTSYWYYFVFPLALDLARTYTLRAAPISLPSPRSFWPTAAALGGFLALLGGLLTQAGLAEPSIGVGVGPRIYSDGARADFLFVTVWNRSDRSLTPRFAVQSGSEQPFFWTIVEGPVTLLPGEKADYQIDTDIWYEQFSLRKGGLLTVADREDYDRRSSVWIPRLEGHAHLGQVVNGDFRFWTSEPLQPVRWSAASWPLSAGSVRASLDSPKQGALDFNLRASASNDATHGRELVSLSTRIALPKSPITFEVRLPENANQLPDLDTLYGIDFITDRARLMVLFGDTDRIGWLTIQGAQVPYRMIKVARRQWSEVELDPRALFQELDADIMPVRHREHAFKGVDFPMTPLEIRLVLGAAGLEAPLAAQFGPILDTGEPGPPPLGTDLLAEPERWAMWIADFNLEARNPQKAREDYAVVLGSDPDFGPALLQAADADMQVGDLMAALDGYTRAIAANADVGRGELGRGDALIALGRPGEALSAYEAALGALEDDRMYLRAEAHVGEANALMAMRACDDARAALQRAWKLKPTMKLPRESLEDCE